MAEVGDAFVSLLPSAKGFGRKMDSQIGPDLDKSGKVGGKRFGGAFAGSLKAVMGPAIALLGIAAAGNFLKGSIAEARESQKVGALTANVIKTTGGVANVTAKQVGRLSTAISNKTGVDDEAIQSGANLLLTFKNVRNEVGKGNKIFDRATQAAADLSASGFGDLTGASKQLGKALNDPVKGIAALGRAGVTFTDQQKKQIATLVATGHTLEAQKIILKEVESQVGGAAAATATNGEKLRVAFDNFKESIGTALLPVLDRLQGFLTNRVIPGLSSLGGSLKTAGTRVHDFFAQGAGHAPAVVAIGAIKDAADKIGDGFQASIDKLDEFQRKVGTLDLNNLDGKKIGAALSTAVSTAVTSIGNLSVKIVAAFGKMLRDVDWVGIGIKAGPAVIGLVVGLAAGILNGITDGHLWQNIWDHGFDIALAVAAVAFAPGKVIGPIAKILGKIPFAGKFIEIVLTALNKAGGRLLSAVGTFLRDIFGNVFTKLFEGVTIPGAGLIVKILASLKGIPAAVGSFLRGLGETIYLRALQAGDKLASGLRAAIPKVLGFVASIPGRILRALGGLLRLLSPRGAQAVDGLLSGIRSRLGSVTNFMHGIPGKIKGAIGSLGGLLVNAGKAIMSGFLSGIKAGWKKVTGFVGGMAGWVKKHKGPLEYDRKLLIPHGNAMMAGLNEGLTLGFGKVQSNVSSMGGQLSSSVALPAGSRLRAADSIAAASSLVGSEPMNEQSMERAFARALSGASFEMSQDNRYLKTKVRRG